MIIDGIFGSGLNRPVEGFGAYRWSTSTNRQQPGGYRHPFGALRRQPTGAVFMHANHLQLRKFVASLFLPEKTAVGRWTARSIGLHPLAMRKLIRLYHFADQALYSTVAQTAPEAWAQGHLQYALIMGSFCKMGAAVLSARSACAPAPGWVSVHVPKCGYEILQIAVPEAIVSVGNHKFCSPEVPELKGYNAIGGRLRAGTKKKVSAKHY